MRQPRYVFLHDAPLLIAEWLESAGWPRAGAEAWQSARAIAEAEHQLGLRERLLREVGAMAARNSSFAPAVGRARTLVATARARLAEARARSVALDATDQRCPARLEAERLLELGAADGDITATSEFQATATARPREDDPVPAAAFRRDDRVIRRHRSEICAPWGQHRDVKFVIASLEAWWAATRNLDEPPVQAAPDEPPVQAAPTVRSSTASQASLLKAIGELGHLPEKELIDELAKKLPGTHIPRQTVRNIRGPRSRGRPKKSPD
jgi:hypothetical protein